MTGIIILIVGYTASVLLAISLLVSNDLKFRWLNTWGCLAFIVYGILINAFPIILTNTILLLINGYHLIKIYRRNENFDLLEFNKDDKLIHKFLSFYQKDIKAYFPEYDPAEHSNNVNFVVLRDMVIANIFVATIMEDGTALVKINYTTPKYRDYKIGKFLFQKEKQFLSSHGIQRLVYTHVFNKQHESYLIKMGFEKELLNDQVCYYKHIL
ncbi:MAG: GNAT family N-acetyltransferase [Ferruginibacter sp.]